MIGSPEKQSERVKLLFSRYKKLDESQSEWQKFHQECAVVALKVFEDKVVK